MPSRPARRPGAGARPGNGCQPTEFGLAGEGMLGGLNSPAAFVGPVFEPDASRIRAWPARLVTPRSGARLSAIVYTTRGYLGRW